MGDRLGIPCVLSIFSNLSTHIGPIDFIFGTFKPLGGLLVVEKKLDPVITGDLVTGWEYLVC